MAVSGKNKGSRFERAVARMIDAWWEVSPKTFARSENSGGVSQPGDIAPRLMPRQAPPWFPFLLECKHYKDFNFFELFNAETKTGPKIIKWWRQTVEAQGRAIVELNYPAQEVMKLMIFKRNNSKIFCAFEPYELKYHEILTLIGKRPPVTTISLYLPNFTEEVLVMDFEIFMSIYTKQMCIQLFSGK